MDSSGGAKAPSTPKQPPAEPQPSLLKSKPKVEPVKEAPKKAPAAKGKMPPSFSIFVTTDLCGLAQPETRKLAATTVMSPTFRRNCETSS